MVNVTLGNYYLKKDAILVHKYTFIHKDFTII